jgi:hypothetical protein
MDTKIATNFGIIKNIPQEIEAIYSVFLLSENWAGYR